MYMYTELLHGHLTPYGNVACPLWRLCNHCSLVQPPNVVIRIVVLPFMNIGRACTYYVLVCVLRESNLRQLAALNISTTSSRQPSINPG